MRISEPKYQEVGALFGSSRLQDLLFTEKIMHLVESVSYVNDVASGHEYVTVDGRKLTIHICSGTTTAATIKTLVEAHHIANDMVTVTVAGTATTAQVVGHGLLFTGGSPARRASRVIGGVFYEASSPAAAGNSKKIRYVEAPDGQVSASASEVGNNLQFFVPGSGVTIDAFQTALDGSGITSITAEAANERASYNNRGTQTYDMCSDWVYLQNGLDDSYASVVVQGLTITANTADLSPSGWVVNLINCSGSGPLLTMASGQIDLGIAEGVTGPDSVEEYLDADADFNTYFTASSTGSTAMWSSYEIEPSGMRKAYQATEHFFQDDSTVGLANSFVRADFGLMAENIVLTNRDASGTDVLEYSFDGENVDGRVIATETHTLTNKYADGIWLRYAVGNPSYSAEAW